MAEFQQDFYPEFERAPEIIVEPDGEEVEAGPVLLDAYWATNGRATDDPSGSEREELERCSTRSRTTSGARRSPTFWTFGGAGRPARWILTILGVAVMLVAFVWFVMMETGKLERQAAMRCAASGAPTAAQRN